MWGAAEITAVCLEYITVISWVSVCITGNSAKRVTFDNCVGSADVLGQNGRRRKRGDSQPQSCKKLFIQLFEPIVISTPAKTNHSQGDYDRFLNVFNLYRHAIGRNYLDDLTNFGGLTFGPFGRPAKAV